LLEIWRDFQSNFQAMRIIRTRLRYRRAAAPIVDRCVRVDRQLVPRREERGAIGLPCGLLL
jgi:hypothetical protein